MGVDFKFSRKVYNNNSERILSTFSVFKFNVRAFINFKLICNNFAINLEFIYFLIIILIAKFHFAKQLLTNILMLRIKILKSFNVY